MKKCVLLLAAFCLLAALVMPTRVEAASADKVQQIQQQITTTYRTALRRSGIGSFNGWCGSLVNWQTLLLGIDQQMYGCDGKNEFDLYRNMDTTTGGYRIKTYSASEYTLLSALNEITNNGTTDAYNILVGFERTNTEMGSIYGHAMLIHAILDGQVYFTECYSTSLGGQYWAEGAPISCSIETFCDYYNAWTVFDGIAYFGVKNYADTCEEYPASMYALVQEDVAVYSEPNDPGFYEAQPTEQTLAAGQAVLITSLLKTPGGAYWYALDNREAYVPAASLSAISPYYGDVTVQNLSVPGALHQYNGFGVRGNVTAANCQLENVAVLVYDTSTDPDAPSFSATLEADGTDLNLDTWKLNRELLFRTLPVGTYRIAIRAQVSTYVLEGNTLSQHTETLTLWRSEFQIVSGWDEYVTISFDGRGGQPTIAQTVTAAGSPLKTLPQASMEGKVFLGWSLDPEGTQLISSETVMLNNITLYAQWAEGGEGFSGWRNINGSWVLYENSAPQTGWIRQDALTLYQRPDGSRLQGWHYLEDTWHYFTNTGALSSAPDDSALLELTKLQASLTANSAAQEVQNNNKPLSGLILAAEIFGTVLLTGGATATAVFLLRKKSSVTV